ncbi:MAG: OmpA family protein [Mariprofundales bacterium]
MIKHTTVWLPNRLLERLTIGLTLVALSACAAAPLETQRAPLHEARMLVEKAKAAGGEQCAPKLQATAVANLMLAAHELNEGGMHWDYNQKPRNAAIQAAQAVLHRCKSPSSTKIAAPSSTHAFPVIYFATKRSQLRPPAKQILLKLAAILQHQPRLRLVIYGFADERGSKEDNLALSQQRAERTASFLRQQGVASKQITWVMGYGEEKPRAHGHNEATWHWNRRVEFRRAE